MNWEGEKRKRALGVQHLKAHVSVRTVLCSWLGARLFGRSTDNELEAVGLHENPLSFQLRDQLGSPRLEMRKARLRCSFFAKLPERAKITWSQGPLGCQR